MAAGDLTTLSNVKQWVISAGTADDQLLTGFITRASQGIQKYLNRTIASQAYTEALDGKGTSRIMFANYPVTAVASLAIDGIVIPPASGPPYACGYVFNETALSVYGYSFCRGYGNVQLSYTAGYDETPPEIEQACIEWIALRYTERQRIGQVSKSLNGEVITFFVGDMPASVKMMLTNWRKTVPI